MRTSIRRASGGRYELLAPVASYAAAHEPATRRLRLAAAAAAMLAEEPGLGPGVAAQRAAVEASAGARAAPGAADVAFVEAALLRAGSRVRCGPRWGLSVRCTNPTPTAGAAGPARAGVVAAACTAVQRADLGHMPCCQAAT